MRQTSPKLLTARSVISLGHINTQKEQRQLTSAIASAVNAAPMMRSVIPGQLSVVLVQRSRQTLSYCVIRQRITDGAEYEVRDETEQHIAYAKRVVLVNKLGIGP